MATRIDLLCACGWSRASVRASEAPAVCPECRMALLDSYGAPAFTDDGEPEEGCGQRTLGI
jgi:hypothetical protein